MAINSVTASTDLTRQLQQPKPQDQASQTNTVNNPDQAAKTRKAEDQAAQLVQQSQQAQRDQKPRPVVNAQGQTIGGNISITA